MEFENHFWLTLAATLYMYVYLTRPAVAECAHIYKRSEDLLKLTAALT